MGKGKMNQIKNIKQKIDRIENDLNKRRKLKEDLVDFFAEMYVFAQQNNLDLEKIKREADKLMLTWWKNQGKIKGKDVSVKTAYKKWAKKYEENFNPLTFTINNKINGFVSNIKGKNVLDLGCGTGKHSFLAAKKGAKVTGFDFSKDMLKQAKLKNKRLKNKIKFVHGNLTKKLPFKSSSFDIVLCSLVLDHIKNIQPIFKEINRVLKKNGRFIFADLHPRLAQNTKYPLFKKDKTEFYTEKYYHSISELFRISQKSIFLIKSILELKVPKKIPAKEKKLIQGTDFFIKPIAIIIEFIKK